MIQRIQTVYLFLAIVSCVVCASLPIAMIMPNGMGMPDMVYNLATIDGGNHEWHFDTCGLFVMLMITVLIDVMGILSYTNRKRQIRLCMLGICSLVLWYGGYAVYAYLGSGEENSYSVCWPVVLPFVAIVFTLLARKGIVHDEKLVRAADRIR